MTTAFAHRSIRAPAATAIAVVGLVGLAGCSAGDSATPDASNSNPTPTSAASSESKTDEASGDRKKCTEEQVATISAPTSVTIPSEDVAEATTDVDGSFQASFDGLTLYGVDFDEFTQETAGFENTDELVLIATNSVDG